MVTAVTPNELQVRLSLAVIEVIVRSGGNLKCRLIAGHDESYLLINYLDYEIFIYDDEAQLHGNARDVRFENYRGRDDEQFISEFIQFFEGEILATS